MVWRPDVEDFVDANDIAGQISEVKTGGLKGSTDKGIENILDIIEATKEYEDPFKIAAAVLVEGINKHLFNDGNHRTMWIVAKQALRRNDKKMIVTEITDFDNIEEDLQQ